MADAPRKPPQYGDQKRLEAELQNVDTRLAALAKQTAEGAEASKAAEAKVDRALARQQGVAGRRAVPATPAEAEQAVQQAERQAVAERKIAQAQADQTGYSARLAQLQQQRALPRGGSTSFRGYPLGPASGVSDAEARRLEEDARRAQRLLPAGPQGFQPFGLLPPGRQFNLPPAGGGYGGQGPPPPAPPGGGGSEEESFRKRIDAARRSKLFTDQATTSEARLTSTLERQMVVLGLSSNAYQRHGYLTSEFISAAAKGRVTIAELGQQVTGTVAKFAGWTTAAAAVYGAVGALAQVGRGAIDAASGVDLVARVIPSATQHSDELQQSFRDLSHEFNLPISDVTDAVYGMGKVFQSIPEAVNSARQALFAVKVGELDAATATRYLTAIVNGFQLQAGALPDVFDAINQAQNRFGGNTGQLIAGVAKAGGAFKLAGGDFRELIALVEAGVKLTGASGENVGTAIARSAGTVLTAAGQARLRAAGLDPTLKYPRLFAQAAQLSQGQSAQRVQQIARALVPAGGQFARIFVPLLQNARLYNKVLADIAPERAKGSAQRELARALRQPNEQIKQLGTNLQQLGSALAQAGGLTLFGGIVHGLNDALHLATQLVEVFDTIPQPLRSGLAVLLQVAGVLRLMRRFDVGGNLPIFQSRGANQLASFVGATPGVRLQKQVATGLGDQTKYLGNLQEQLAKQAAFTQFEAEFYATRAAQNTGDEALMERAKTAADQATLSQEKLTAISQQYQLALTQEQEFAAVRLRSEQEVLARMRTLGITYYPTTLGRPVPAGTGLGGGVQGAEGGAAAAGGAEGAAVGGGAYAATLALQQRLRAAEAERAGMGVLARTSEAGAQRLDSVAEAARASTQGGALLAASATAAAGTVRGVAAGVGGLAGALRGFGLAALGALGPFELILAAGIGIPLILESANKLKQNTKKAIAQPYGATPDQLRQQAADIQHQARSGGLFAQIGDQVLHGNKTVDSADAEAQRRLSYANELAKQQSRGVGLTITQIQRSLKQNTARVTDRIGKIAAINKALDELEKGYAVTRGGSVAKQAAAGYRATLEQELADLQAARSNIEGALKSITTVAALQTFSTETQNRVQLQGLTGSNLNRAVAQLRKDYQLLSQPGTSPDDRSKYIADIQQIQQLIDTEAKKRLDRLTAAKAPKAEIASARAGYLATVRRSIIGSIDDAVLRLRVTIAQDKAQIANLAQDVNAETAKQLANAAGPGTGNIFGPLAAPQLNPFHGAQKNNSKLRSLEQKTKGETDMLRGLAQEQKHARDIYQGIVDEQKQQAKQLDDANKATERIAEFQSRQALATARANIGATQEQTLRRAVSDAQAFANFVKGLGSKAGKTAYTDALTAIANAQAALQDYELQQAQALQQAHTQLALSLTNDPVKQALIQLRGARGALRFDRTPAERLQGQADINNAARAYKEARYKATEDDIEFEAEMGRITKDTEIRRLEALAKSVKGDKDFRRQLLLRIHQLKTEAEDATSLDLSVGDIKLPSIYEVRRAAAAVRQGLSITQSYATTIQVARPQDASLVGATFDRYHRGTGKAIERATARR